YQPLCEDRSHLSQLRHACPGRREGAECALREALHGNRLRWGRQSAFLHGSNHDASGRCQEDVRGHRQGARSVKSRCGKAGGRPCCSRTHCHWRPCRAFFVAGLIKSIEESSMRISFAAPELPTDGVVAVLVPEDASPTGVLARIDEAMEGAIARLLSESRFKGKKGQVKEFFAPRGLSVDRLVLVGLGKADKAGALEFEAAGGALAAHLNGAGVSEASLQCDPIGTQLDAAKQAAHAAAGARLRCYRFDKYRTKEEEEKKLSLTALR